MPDKTETDGDEGALRAEELLRTVKESERDLWALLPSVALMGIITPFLGPLVALFAALSLNREHLRIAGKPHPAMTMLVVFSAGAAVAEYSLVVGLLLS